MLSTILIFVTAAACYGLMATKWYSTEIVLAPAETRQINPLVGQLGGLAALAGVSVSDGEVAEALAVMRSKDLAREFINDLSLLPIFFYDDWDSQKKTWKSTDPDDWPDDRDAVAFFHKRIMTTFEDKKTGLVTLRIDWIDSNAAQEWARQLVKRTNEKMRQQALKDSEANLAYLQSELTKTNLVTLQDATGQLIETELKRLMLARGNAEFAFRIIDDAASEKDPIWPRPLLLLTLAFTSAVLFSVIIIFAFAALKISAGMANRSVQ